GWTIHQARDAPPPPPPQGWRPGRYRPLPASCVALMIRRRRGRGARLGAASAAPALLGRGVALGTLAVGNQCFPLRPVAGDEGGPPFADFLPDFARGAAQQQEIVAGAHAWMFQQLVGRFAAATFEARLHGP